MIYYIYLITNKINNKTYVGQRKCPANKFPEQDISYMGSGKIILQAFQRYGIKNFSKEILAIAHTKQNINILEKVFIASYRVENKAEYNIANGGDGGVTYIWTEEQKQHLSNLEKGKVFSKETRKKISEAVKGDKNHNYGKYWFNNGIKNVLAETCPEGFVRGMIINARPWNKGKIGIYSAETRRKMGAKNKGNSYTKGCKLSEQHKQKLREVNLGIKKGHWWTNGVINVVCFECPEGFFAGKTHKKRKNIKK